MGGHSRTVNALVATCVLLLVAAGVTVVVAFRAPGTAGGAHISAGKALAPLTLGSAPETTTEPPTTIPAPTTVPAVTTTSPPAPPPPPPTVDPNHRSAVGTYSVTLVDSTRPTPAVGPEPSEPSRTLPTVVRYPVEGPAGPYPLIVFAHGFNTTPETYANLLHAWASAGYVVAAPAFPRTAADRPLDEEDLINQPGDISFVITRLLEASRGPGPLTGRIDPARIGVAGHSDGGITTLGAGYNSCCRDARISADVVGAADLHDFPGGTYFSAAGPPLLVIQGDQDTLNPPEFSQQVFDDAHSPKYLLWLINAQHLEPYTSDQPHLQVVEQATTAFFDTYLKARPDGPARLRAAASSSLASLRAG